MTPIRSLQRRQVIGLLGALACAPRAYAQTWPGKPIRIIVGYSPGGAVDIIARAVAQPLSASVSPYQPPYDPARFTQHTRGWMRGRGHRLALTRL